MGRLRYLPRREGITQYAQWLSQPSAIRRYAYHGGVERIRRRPAPPYEYCPGGRVEALLPSAPSPQSPHHRSCRYPECHPPPEALRAHPACSAGHAAGHQNFLHLTGLFQLRHLQDIVNSLLQASSPKASRYSHHHIGTLRRRLDRMSRSRDGGHHLFAVTWFLAHPREINAIL